MKRSSFIRKLFATFGTLAFWRPKAAAIPPVEFDEFDYDGFKSIMWAIDNEFGIAEGIDPWIAARPEFLTDAPARIVSHSHLVGRLNNETKCFELKWGSVAQSPIFKGEDFIAAVCEAVEWGQALPDSRVYCPSGMYLWQSTEDIDNVPIVLRHSLPI